MKAITFFVVLSLSLPGRSQKGFTPADLNHFAAPKMTQVRFHFEAGMPVPTNVSILQKHILGDPFKLDTLLSVGTTQISVNLLLETPSLISVKIGDHMDHLFALPGHTLEVAYADMEAFASSEKEVRNNEDLHAIHQYYRRRIPISGNRQDPLAAYRTPIRSMTDFKTYSTYYDTLNQKQLALLAESQTQLPPWFVDYETKNIYYTGLSFKLYMARSQRSAEKSKAPLEEGLLNLLDGVALNDEMASLSLFYTEALKDLALLKYCPAACFTDSKDKWPLYYGAMLKLGHQISSEPVRDLYLARTFFIPSRLNQSLPPEITQVLERGVSDDYLRRIKTQMPNLDGQPAPNFYLKDLAGQFHRMDDFKGKVILLNFWFVGCKGCLLELEHEQQLVDQFGEAPFALLNICTNSKERDWRKWVEEKQLPGVNLYAAGNWSDKVTNSYRVQIYPTYVLIGKDGTVEKGQCSKPSDGQLAAMILELLE